MYVYAYLYRNTGMLVQKRTHTYICYKPLYIIEAFLSTFASILSVSFLLLASLLSFPLEQEYREMPV